jgi:DNA repair protein RecO (recombination protein O)
VAEEPEARRLREYHVVLNRTEGIVLKSSIYGEADLIVTYLTGDHGIVKVFAKSPRKTKSRFGSSLEPLTYSKISYIGKEDANLPRLTQSDIITPFYTLREDYKSFARICGILELITRFLPERDPNPEIFGLLHNLLSRIKPGEENCLYYLYFKVRFLAISGYLPRLDACGRCSGKTVDTNLPANFYCSHGALICDSCGGDKTEAIPVSQAALRFYLSFVKWRFSNIDRVKAPAALVSEIAGLMDAHIKYISSRPLRTVIYNENRERK